MHVLRRVKNCLQNYKYQKIVLAVYCLDKQPYFYNLHKILLTLVMGRGDKKTKKGKISKGSFGKSRPARPTKKKAEKATEPKA